MNEQNEALRVFPHDKGKVDPRSYDTKHKVPSITLRRKDLLISQHINKRAVADIFKKRYH